VKYKHIVGFEAPTEEYICFLEGQDSETLFSEFNIGPDKVEFWEDPDAFSSFLKAISAKYDILKTSGGTIANTLSSFCLNNFGDKKTFQVELYGPYHKNNYTDPNNPLDSLRFLGINLNLQNTLVENRKSICIIDRKQKEVQKIILLPNRYDLNVSSDNIESDYFILTLQCLEGLSVYSFNLILDSKSEIVILIADYTLKTQLLISRLNLLLENNKISYIVGQYKELLSMGILEGNIPESLFKSTEIIGTNGAKDVYIYDPINETFKYYKVTPANQANIESTLGAGDAYFGSYLWSRLTGSNIMDSHAMACTQGLAVLNSPTSRSPVSINLNKYYGTIMEGRIGDANTDSGHYSTVRTNCGFVVASCGQTGIDQVGLEVASDLGLASYALMPKGQRTENTEGVSKGQDCLFNSMVLEYSSSSYRFATYSTVFTTDGTLIFDYINSEGCKATRDACKLLGRPFLDLAHEDIVTLNEKVWNWVVKNGIRVINIAGNRERLITQEQLNDAKRKISFILRYISIVQQTGIKSKQLKGNLINPNLEAKIALSNSTESKKLIIQFLKDIFKKEVKYPISKLVWEFPDLGLNFFFVRSRDIPSIIKQNFCEIGFCGNDILIESEINFPHVINTGLQPCIMVEVKSKKYVKTEVIRTQYPVFCRTIYKENPEIEILPVQGSAEAWLVDNWCDTIFDTWKTGKTVRENNLLLHKQHNQTFLHICHQNQSPEIEEFVSYFKHWLYGTEPDFQT